MLPIDGYPEYSVTDDGRVWSEKSQKFLKPKPDKDGYLYVRFNTGGRVNLQRTKRRLHRLVLDAFVGSHPVGLQCRHLNGNKTDNRISNLKWGTAKENKADAIKHGTAWHALKGSKHHGAKLTEIDALMIRWLRAIKNWTYRRLAKQFSVCVQSIELIVNHKTWKHVGGY